MRSQPSFRQGDSVDNPNLPPGAGGKGRQRLNQSLNNRPGTGGKQGRYQGSDNGRESDHGSSRYRQPSTGRDGNKGTKRQSVIQSILEESDGNEDDPDGRDYGLQQINESDREEQAYENDRKIPGNQINRA